MSEVTLTILDWERAIHGRVHGSDADRAIAALTAEPETIDELDLAMCRFTGRTIPCKQQAERQLPGHFSYFTPGASEEPWDAGVVIIDLAARLIAGKSTYAPLTTEGSVLDGSPDRRSDDSAINFRLSNEWQVAEELGCWRAMSERLLAKRKQQTFGT
jgi:hypothetical protein